MNKFRNLIVLAPLAFALHHFEEHIIFNFREWRLKYFLDNNPRSTEEILVILISITLILIFINLVKNNKVSAHLLLCYLMTTQVVNAGFHIFFSIYYQDFSPGVITAVLLYLPINYLIIKSALSEKLVKNYYQLFIIFILGILIFSMFELFGPRVIAITGLLGGIYYYWNYLYEKKRAR